MRLADKNYFYSNQVVSVPFRPTPDCVFLAKKILTTSDISRRRFLADAIVQDLCETARLPQCEVIVLDKKQRHRKDAGGRLRMKIYGLYKPAEKKIWLYQRTAIQGKILAPKSFLLTLMHEFMHHYDTYALKIRSIHSSGFYQRIHSLQSLLLPS